MTAGSTEQQHTNTVSGLITLLLQGQYSSGWQKGWRSLYFSVLPSNINSDTQVRVCACICVYICIGWGKKTTNVCLIMILSRGECENDDWFIVNHHGVALQTNAVPCMNRHSATITSHADTTRGLFTGDVKMIPWRTTNVPCVCFFCPLVSNSTITQQTADLSSPFTCLCSCALMVWNSWWISGKMCLQMKRCLGGGCEITGITRRSESLTENRLNFPFQSPSKMKPSACQPPAFLPAFPPSFRPSFLPSVLLSVLSREVTGGFGERCRWSYIS